MPVSINDMYQSAYKNEVSWEQALLLTGVLYVGMEGLVVSPPPHDKYEYHFYKLRLADLSEYPSNNIQYTKVIKVLSDYISDYNSLNT